MLLTTEQLDDIADRFARVPHGEIDAAAAWFAESSLTLPTPSGRELAACLVMVLGAVGEGADAHLAVQVLADALAETEHPTPGRGIVPLRARLAALTNPYRNGDRSDRY
jgi:hypothetical protein